MTTPYPSHSDWASNLQLDMTASDTDPPTYQATIITHYGSYTSAPQPTPYLAASDALRKAHTYYTTVEWVAMMPTGPWHDAAVKTFRYLLPNPSAVYDERFDEMQARISSLEAAVRDLYQTVVKLSVRLSHKEPNA